ncbi:MAG: hypothetical protein ACRDID_00435, partial [Ktedonobacterales bacterium]
MPANEPASATPPAKAAGALPLQPDALARALRAVASELERDPALARRVTAALRLPAPVGIAAATTSTT